MVTTHQIKHLNGVIHDALDELPSGAERAAIISAATRIINGVDPWPPSLLRDYHIHEFLMPGSMSDG